MEQKIKDLLNSPTEQNQRLGCQMAKSILNWSNFDIIMYVLNTNKNWELYKRVVYGVKFLGGRIYYSLEYGQYNTNIQYRLIFRGSRNNKNKKIAMIPIRRIKKYFFFKPSLKSYANKFIEQNL